MTQAQSDIILERMMALHPKLIDMTLDRVYRLLDALGNPQNALPDVIHIAGTNGKGSTQAMIRAGLEAAGCKVHAYTSPHLARFHERIRLAGKLIEEDHLSEVLDTCYDANQGAPITYFEITTCAAILAFSKTRADYTLLEVGLGGRLDTTNIVDQPRLTVITPISMDHEAFLGDTIAQIAGEKAGIIKNKVPCIVGPQDEDAIEVIEQKAARHFAPLQIYGQHWHAAPDRDRMMFQDDKGLLDLPRPNLLGDHQIQNAGTAIAALRELGFDADACEGAVTHAEWPARMQRLKSGPLFEMAHNSGAELWLDGGHNPAAGKALAATLKQLPERPTFLICGMLNTKDVTGYLSPLSSAAQSLTAVSIPGEQATLPAEETAAAAEQVGFSSKIASDSTDALSQILDLCPDARVLICGSLYLAGHILRDHG